MTKHAGLSDFFNDRLGPKSLGEGTHGHLSEPELSVWAEQAMIAGNERSNCGRLGTLVFWSVIAALLIARFFIIDPAKLRPESASAPASLSSVMPPKYKLPAFGL
jgi:hypothetical protein